MQVFVTGATGLIGRRLVRALAERGDTPVSLTRKPPKQPPPGEVVGGDPTTAGPWVERMRACDAVVHLAGAGLFDRRWSAAYMQELRDSRINSTKLIAEALAEPGHDVDTLVSGSAVGFYGTDRGDTVLDEDDQGPSTVDFLADLCEEWEYATRECEHLVLRIAYTRTGIVLDPDGGALPTMARPYRLYAGGRIGSGKQYVSWIHREDMTRLLLFALDTDGFVGAFNACGPNPATNDEFGRTLGKVLGRPHWLPAPGFAVRLAVGKVAETVLGSLRVVPAVATHAGFTFRFPELEPALRDLLAPETSTARS